MKSAASPSAIRNSRLDLRLPSIPETAWVALGLALAFWPVWRWYGLRLNDGSDEPMGLAALATAGWFLWQSRDRIGIDRSSLLAATFGLIGYGIAFPWLSPLPRAVVALVVIALAFRLVKAGPGICLLLMLSLPVIATAQFYLGWPLRWITAVGSEALLQLGFSELSREGTVIWWRDTPVNVDAPCSGVRMLWTGFFMHAVLLAKHRTTWGRAVWLTALVMLLILAANVVRATLLFFKESGALDLPEWTHAAIGLVVFAALLVLLATLHRRLAVTKTETPEKALTSPSAWQWRFAATAAVLAASMPWLAEAARGESSPRVAEVPFPGWPTSWDGCDLVPVELAEHERAFADRFPGDLAVFRTTEGPWSRRVIVRWITAPTRKLHSSADCLRAEGFEMNRDWEIGPADERWATWTAYHSDNGATFRVRERLWTEGSPNQEWSEVSAWFWDATLRGKSGPWWAVTVIEPLNSEHE